MTMRSPFGIGEWYHCYNRGVDKRTVFEDAGDYNRFLILLYLGNGSVPLHLANLKNHNIRAVIENASIERGEQLVEIGAYALMPNHFHLALKEIIEGGITMFMQRIFTAFTMYFNKKYDRTGALFAGPFKSRYVGDDRYLKHLISYQHLNAAELFEPRWKEGIGNLKKIEKQLVEYPYSSLHDFLGQKRSERKILGDSIFELYDSIPTLAEIIEEARAYYVEYNEDRP
jgi:putative transposase